MQRGFATILLVALVAMLSVVIVGAALYTKYRSPSMQHSSLLRSPLPSAQISPSLIPTASSNPLASGWSLYTDQEFGFRLQYPAAWHRLPTRGGGVAITPWLPQSLGAFFGGLPGVEIYKTVLPSCTTTAEYLNDYLHNIEPQVANYPSVQLRTERVATKASIDAIAVYGLSQLGAGAGDPSWPTVFVMKCKQLVSLSYNPTDLDQQFVIWHEILTSFEWQ